MKITITEADPFDPAVADLLRASHRLMESLFPPEHNSYLDLEALVAPDVTLWAGRAEAQVLGTIALLQQPDYGEVKSLFVHDRARDRGLGQQLLRHLETEARGAGMDLLRLETGNLLTAAVGLYEGAGFVRCGAFGNYVENGTSVFYEKRLSPAGS